MILEPYKKYVVICKGEDELTYRWNLTTLPGRKAWNILYKDIQPNTIFFNHFIISIEDVSTELKSTFMEHTALTSESIDEESITSKMPILMSEDIFTTIELDLPPEFAYTSTYRCDFCNGVVVNDICTECMFDWDS